MRSIALVVAVLSFAACSSEVPSGSDGGDDGGADAQGSGCTATSCDDGVYCNGTETCADGACVDGDPPCAATDCDESTDHCAAVCPDDDRDGARALACGGTDCDDSDPLRYPGSVETCNTRDEDCDGSTLGDDLDGDGFVADTCCNPQPSGELACGADCDDRMAAVSPDGIEVCNGTDDDCDGAIDEGVQLTFYRDVDGDLAGRDTDVVMGCTAPLGYAFEGGDCNDMNRNVNPGATESCNGGIDDNCDGDVDPGCACTDGASFECGEPDGAGGFLAVGECRVGTITCVAGALQPCTGATLAQPESSQACNGRDEDCDGVADDGVDVGCYVDADNDDYAPAGATLQRLCPSADPAREPFGYCPFGYTDRTPTATVFDCADTAIAIHPGVVEVCNLLDDDCNGMTDDGPGAPRTCYVDDDGDSYAPTTAGATTACTCPTRTTSRVPGAGTTDCNDASPTVSPVAGEVCDAASVDENCNGMTNEGCACVPPASRACPQPGACGGGTQTCMTTGGGSAWGTCSVSPSDESCNATDDDCDGSTDETFACVRGSAAIGCTTGCGTAGTAACTTSCTRDACRAAEICNFCDDNADGVNDIGLSGTQRLDVTACSATTRTGDASCPYLVDGSEYSSGSLRFGDRRVGYGPVTARVGFSMTQDGGAPPSPDGLVTVAIQSGTTFSSRQVFARFDFASSQLQVGTYAFGGSETILGTAYLSGSGFDFPYSAYTWVHAMRVVYTPPIGGAAQRVEVFLDGSTSAALTAGFGTTPFFSIGTGVRGVASLDNLACPIAATIQTSVGATYLEALQTCP